MRSVFKRFFILLLCGVLLLPSALPVSAADTTVYTIGKGNNKQFADALPDTQSAYAAGSANWCLESYSMSVRSAAKFYSNTTTKLTCVEGDYFVYRIKSPGSGVRTLSLEHCSFFRGGEGSFYILDTDTVDIEAALVPENRVGKVDFYDNETTTTTDISWGHNTLIGSWDFGTDKEYFLVLELTSTGSPINTTFGFMYPTSLTITKGMITPAAPALETRSIQITDKTIGTFEVATYAATGMINNQAHIYIPTEGKKLFIYNLETGEKYDEVNTMFTVCRGITVDAENRVWMVGSQYFLQCYDPTTKTLSTYSTQGEMESGFDLIVGDNGCLYFGSSMNANLYEFDPSTETLRNLGVFNTDAAYSCGLAYDPAGYLYAGLTGNKNNDNIHTREVVKIRLSDGKCVGRTDVSNCVNKKEIMIRGAAVVNGIYIAGANEIDHMLAINTETMEQTELTYNGTVITNPICFSVSESYNGKHYFMLRTNGYNYVDKGDGTYTGVKGSVKPGFYAMDDKTGEITFVSGGMNHSAKMGQDSIIEIGGDDCFLYMGGGSFRVYNFTTGEITSLDKLVSNTDISPVQLDSIATGVPGSNEILIGAFNNDKCSIFNAQTGTITGNFYTNGQTDCMLTYNGELYVGNYKDGVLVRVDKENKENNEVLIDFRYTLDPNGEPFSQVRVHALAAGDGKVFAGTMPDSYLRGGCIGWYDTVTGETYIERNVVQDQSINSLVYHNGYLYGTTTTQGGTGSGEDTSLSAKMFIYDVANKKKVLEIDLRNYISGLPSTLSYVGGIVADPDIATNGKLWGVVCETLFTMTYNAKTNKVTITEQMAMSKVDGSGKAKYAGSGSKPKDILFQDGYIYVYFGDSNYFAKLNYADPTQYSRLPIKAPSAYVIGEDKNLYYYYGSVLYMYPLAVTNTDKTKAASVLSMITALDKTITIANEAEVEAARAAYDNLTWTQRAMIQNSYLLDEAECDLLEAHIAAIDPENPDQNKVNELLRTYNAMTDKQKTYIANIDVLKEIQNELQSFYYAIGDETYNKLETALADAKRGSVIKLLQDKEEGEVILTKNVTLDLNSNTLVCDSLDAAALGYGNVMDSSDGRGLLVTTDMLLRENNTQLPLWDPAASGYRFFGYTLVLDYVPEIINSQTRKFWYKMDFTAAKAYELIEQGVSGLEIGTDIELNGDHLIRVLFGRGANLSTDTFSKEWAQAMTAAPDTTWLYVNISGMNNLMPGSMLEVIPLVTANGVAAQAQDGCSNAIIYKNYQGGYQERE